MNEGSNRLPVLLEAIKNANVVFAKAERLGAEAAFDMGVALVEAKALCQHGEWTDFLEQTGVTPRSAQRYMRVVRAGMDKEYVALVGLSEALAEIDAAQAIMPDAYTATKAVWEAEDGPDIMIWWRVDQFNAGFVQVYTIDTEKGVAQFLHVASMKLYLVAFMIDVFANGIDGRRQRDELWRRSISFRDRDQQIEFLREEARKFAESREPA